ncbi:MAG TPA: AsmA family protein [Methyloceanibacter sp.]
MNHFLLSLTAVLILVLSALFAVPYFVDWNDYRHVFEAQATKLLGRDVRVGGEVHLVLLPAPQLRFDDVKVADAEGNLDQPFLEARRLEAGLSIGALLSGAIEARNIGITGPVLRLELNADGTGNWADVGRPGEAMPFMPKEVLLDQIDVTGGTVELTRAGAPVATLIDVTGDASAASLSGPYKVAATYKFLGRKQDLKFSTSASNANGKVRLKSALRDPDRDTLYLLDGDVTGLGEKPSYDGTVVVRNALSVPEPQPQPPTSEPGEAAESGSGFELKGDLTATADRAELPGFELTIHAKGHPQLMKGKLAFDFGETRKLDGELSARFLDVDALLADEGQEAASPSAVLNQVAEKLLSQSASIGEGNFLLVVEQANFGGDLVGELGLALITSPDQVRIERLTAKLPGETNIETTGLLTRGDKGPVYAGPMKLEGSKLRTLARWASGDRDISTQTGVGVFTLAADTTLGGGNLKLENASGELSDTKFTGSFTYLGGAKPAVDVALDSDRLDLKNVLGEDVAWRSWLPVAGKKQDSAGSKESLAASLRNENIHVALRVGELLLPSIAPGKLEANFSLVDDTLDVTELDFLAEGALKLSGKGRIEHISDAPSGQIDLAINAANADSLRVATGLVGFSDGIARSKHLASLTPLDVTVALVTKGAGHATEASLVVNGTAGGSDVAVKAEAKGEPAKLDHADIALIGSIAGERPQTILGLLLPDVPQDTLATGGKGKLSFELHGVPKSNLAGRVALETQAMTISFDGQGAFKDDGLALTGKAQATTPNTGLAMMLFGFEASPGATNVPLNLRADIAKAAQRIDFKGVAGEIAGEPLQGSVSLDLSGDVNKVTLDARVGAVSLPVLLGGLVAWQRTPSTEQMLGTLGGGASEVWPARGFSLGPLAKIEGDFKLAAKSLSLGSPFLIQNAALMARAEKGGLSIASVQGRLFGGTFAGSGTLSPRGTGAGLQATADLKGGRLEDLSKGLAGKVLAKGPFSLSFNVSGEGLSPPGLVAGLSGEGTLSLEPGVVQAMSQEPLRRVAVEAAKTKKFKDKEQITVITRALREGMTRGTYKYGAVAIPFDIKNGTLKLKPATLASKGTATTINGYVELASLRLDSEWEMRLDGNADLPPVSLVLAGPLNNAGTIAPAVDTEAVESYLTMRRMQEDVERLETLDVSGRNPQPNPKPDAEAGPAGATFPNEAEAPPIEPEPVPESKPAPPPKAPVAAKPTALPAPAKPETPEPRAAEIEPKKVEPPREIPAAAVPQPETLAKPAPEAVPAPPETATPPATDVTATGDATAIGTGLVTPATPKPVRPKRPTSAPDDWKKGIGIFGGG